MLLPGVAGVGVGRNGARKDLESLCQGQGLACLFSGASSRNSVGPCAAETQKRFLLGEIGEERIRMGALQGGEFSPPVLLNHKSRVASALGERLSKTLRMRPKKRPLCEARQAALVAPKAPFLEGRTNPTGWHKGRLL